MAKWKDLSNRIPHRIHLGKKHYAEVVWVDDFPDGKTLGETRFEPLQIAIKKKQSDKETVLTYLHEVIHCIDSIHSIGLTETQVLKLEKALTPILKDDNVFTKKKRKAK
jgi:hypothetical protein